MEVFEYRGRDYIRADQAEAIMTPKPKGTKEDKKKGQREALHRQLYDKQVKDGVFSAGSSAVYDGKNIKAESECPHPFESLRWNPNQHGIYAKCILCNLKSVIAYKTFADDDEVKQKLKPRVVHVVEAGLRGDQRQVHVASRDLRAVHAVTEEHTTDAESSLVYAVALKKGLVMIDTGCRRACGGRIWHENLRKELDARGVRYHSQQALEYFQFGPGEPIPSHTRWTYDVGVMGVANYELDSVSEAIDQVPGLIGQDELVVWHGKIDFTDKSVEVFGQKGEIIPAASGHPCLSLLEFPDDGFLGEQWERVDHQEPPREFRRPIGIRRRIRDCPPPKVISIGARRG